MTNCIGDCSVCTVDHSAEVETANRGHGISYSKEAKEYALSTTYLNKDENNKQILSKDMPNVYYGEFGGWACGDIVNLWVKLAEDKDTIIDIKFLSTGCWGSLSSTSYGCEAVLNKKLSELNIAKLNVDIMTKLQLPQIKKHCSVFIGHCLEQIKAQLESEK